MSIYKETIEELKKQDLVTELYRFQGANSYECLIISKEQFLGLSDEHYVYISKSLDHHKHFIVKRLRQLINEDVLKDTDLQVTSKNIAETASFNRIKNLCVRAEALSNPCSIKLVCDKQFTNLISANSVKSHRKGNLSLIERVDRRAYGGGYGLDQEWKDLLQYFTYFAAVQKIEREDVLRLITNMRRTGRMNRKDNATFIPNESHTIIRINPLLESNLTKYRIIQSLEGIIEKGLYPSDSELGLHPDETIKRMLTSYETTRQKILTKLKDHREM